MSTRRGAIDLWSGVGLVVASMVGTGVLVSNGFMASALSPKQTFAVWIAQAFMAIAGAIAYSQISRMIPRSGGEFRYLTDLIHPSLGYLAGWTSLLVGFAAPVATAAATAGSFASEVGMPLPEKVTAAIVIALVTAFQMFDLKAAKWSQNIFVAIKTLLFLALIGLGVSLGRFELPAGTPASAPAGVFAINLFFAAYAFSGWNASIYAAEEFVNPRRDVARSMIIGLLLVTAIYLAVTFVFVFNLGPEEIAALGDSKERSAHVLVSKLLGPGAAIVASIGIVLVLLSSCNVMTLVGPRVNAAMAADGFLPYFFVAEKGKPPTKAILFQGAVAMALMLSHSLKGLIENIGIMLTVMSALTVAGLVRVRFSRAAQRRFGGQVPSLVSTIAAAAYFVAVSWMFYYAIKLGSSGVWWVAIICAAALTAYVLTNRLRRSAE